MYTINKLHFLYLFYLFLLFRCSRLFKQNKNDFDIICRYVIEDLIELISEETIFVGVIMVS